LLKFNIPHVFAVSPEDQCLSTGAGNGPGPQGGKQVDLGIDAQDNGGPVLRARKEQWHNQVQVQSAFRIAVRTDTQRSASGCLQRSSGLQGRVEVRRSAFRIPQDLVLLVKQEHTLEEPVFPEVVQALFQHVTARCVTGIPPVAIGLGKKGAALHEARITNSFPKPVRDLPGLEVGDSQEAPHFLVLLLLESVDDASGREDDDRHADQSQG
jgi:hypothetical protein